MDRINKNQTVWAKLRYCPYWPSYIVEKPPPALEGKIPRRKLCVYFFGSRNFGIVSVENLQPYLEHRSKYIKKNRSALFQKAVEECDCYMADNENECSNYALKSGRITVKRELEPDVEIKNDPDKMYIDEEYVIESKCDGCQERERQINELHSTVHCLKEKCTEKDQQIRNLSTQVDALKEELRQVEVDQGIYELERIIQHKKVRGKYSYFVRWKGFGSNEDSWIDENNFQCQEMLGDYKKLHRL